MNYLNKCGDCIYMKGSRECANCTHNKQDNFVSQKDIDMLYNSLPKTKIVEGEAYRLVLANIVNGTPIVSYARRGTIFYK